MLIEGDDVQGSGPNLCVIQYYPGPGVRDYTQNVINHIADRFGRDAFTFKCQMVPQQMRPQPYEVTINGQLVHSGIQTGTLINHWEKFFKDV